MNKFRQFWAIFKFQVSVNPFVILLPLAMAMPYFIPYFYAGKDTHPDLVSLLSNANLFFVGLIAVILLAPEISRYKAYNAMWPTGTEFLLTRAVDRPMVLRARSAFFYFLILVIPVFTLFWTLKAPDLQVREYDKLAYEKILDQVPGSIAGPASHPGMAEEITIRNGTSLVGLYHIWIYLCIAVCTEVFVYLIYPLRYRQIILWVTFYACVFIPSARFVLHTNGPSLGETVFFAYVAHQALLWITAIAAVILGHLWCERRFERMEQ